MKLEPNYTISKFKLKYLLNEFISLDKCILNQDNTENYSIYHAWCYSTTQAQPISKSNDLNTCQAQPISKSNDLNTCQAQPISFKYLISLIKKLAKNLNLSNNITTTKNIAAQPSRHTLAIFTPNAISVLSVSIMSLLDTCVSKLSSVYGGLIEPNTRPKGNKLSPLCWIVETRHLTSWVVKTTENIGVFTMNTNTSRLHNETTKTPLFNFVGTNNPTQARQPSNKTNSQQFDNFLVHAPSKCIATCFADCFTAFAHANYLKSIYPLADISIYRHQSLIDTWDNE